MVFKAVFALTVLIVLGASTMVGGRFLGLIDGPPETTTTACAALTAPQRRALAGTRTPYAQERSGGSSEDGAERSCRWTAAEDDDSTWVEVTTMAAGRWVIRLTRDLAVRRGTDDAAGRRVRERALALGSGADDQEACTLASQVFGLDGADAGATQHVTFHPGDRRTPPRVVAEECLAGTYTELVVAAPRLQDGATLERRALTALGQAQQQLS